MTRTRVATRTSFWPFGEIFTLVAYGQLILEAARIHDVPGDVVDQIFDCFVRDISKFALQLYSKPR